MVSSYCRWYGREKTRAKFLFNNNMDSAGKKKTKKPTWRQLLRVGQYRSDPKHPIEDERKKKPRPFEGVERVASPARKVGMFDGMSPEAAQRAGKRMLCVADCALQREKGRRSFSNWKPCKSQELTRVYCGRVDDKNTERDWMYYILLCNVFYSTHCTQEIDESDVGGMNE